MIFLRWSCALLLGAAGLLGAETAAKKSFDIPADAAARSLKRFSEQASLQVIFPSQVVAGVRTHAIKGEMTPREALEGMLRNTGLALIHDEKTGAYSVRKETNGQGGKPPGASPPASAELAPEPKKKN
jgi:hypothetical protein